MSKPIGYYAIRPIEDMPDDRYRYFIATEDCGLAIRNKEDMTSNDDCAIEDRNAIKPIGWIDDSKVITAEDIKTDAQD